MDRSTKAPGSWVRSLSGAEAFVPAPLPPELRWTDRLVRVLSEADRALGQLAGEGRRLPNPHLLLRPFIRREAVLSSRIEGTQATLGELLAAEAGSSVERSPDDLREVANYVAALEYGLQRLETLPLSLRLLRELHARLMEGVRGGNATPGEFRRIQNWIGPPGATLQDAAYVPPPPDEMKACLGALEGFLQDRALPPLVQIALAHYQFEAIHPFLDGNGRVGRLLVTIFLVERGVLPSPLLYLSAFFEASRAEYYERLRAVSLRGEWGPWLEYFLRGVARQAEDALERASAINRILDEWRGAISGSASRTPGALVDLLAENPYWTIRGAARRLGIAYTTAQRAFERLVDLSALEEVSGARRDRVYCAARILDILDAPTRVSATASPGGRASQ
ncbi:MAG: Fic family protein [Deltaproteobacteria bacterium]|nr:Fic family protein [Deltaproteobacteria bacterium]